MAGLGSGSGASLPPRLEHPVVLAAFIGRRGEFVEPDARSARSPRVTRPNGCKASRGSAPFVQATGQSRKYNIYQVGSYLASRNRRVNRLFGVFFAASPGPSSAGGRAARDSDPLSTDEAGRKHFPPGNRRPPGHVSERGPIHQAGDIQFTFPTNTVLSSNAFVVVARRPADVQKVYGIANVAGPYTPSLPDGTGTIRLEHRNGGVLLEAHYRSEQPWPAAGSHVPGEPPTKALAAHAATSRSPYEGRARTSECPVPRAAAGQGASDR